MNIFVGSLPFKIEESELQEIFEEYGEVTSVKIITDRATGRSKGFGFVEMTSEEEAKKAIDELNNAEIEGRTIVVNKAEEKKEGVVQQVAVSVVVILVAAVVSVAATQVAAAAVSVAATQVAAAVDIVAAAIVVAAPAVAAASTEVAALAETEDQNTRILTVF